MRLKNVRDPEFGIYGRVITGYDFSELTAAMQQTPVPKDVTYVASVPEFESLPEAKWLKEEIYGQMPIQIGYCNGHNRNLNALEYHRDSEVNLAVTDLILLLGRQQDIASDHTFDTGKVEAFFVPEGTLIEVYGTTLHYAPCQTTEEGFRCVVILPKGTNAELDATETDRTGEHRLLFARNKWLLGHSEGGLPEQAWIGLKGENITVTQFK